jgi:hypothetical protein
MRKDERGNVLWDREWQHLGSTKAGGRFASFSCNW